MAIVIEDPEVVQRIQRLSTESGNSTEVIVARAIDAYSPRYRSGPLTGQRKEDALRALHAAQVFFCAGHEPKDTRPPDEIIGYDENGLPN
jgi:hypothetical protein